MLSKTASFLDVLLDILFGLVKSVAKIAVIATVLALASVYAIVQIIQHTVS